MKVQNDTNEAWTVGVQVGSEITNVDFGPHEVKDMEAKFGAQAIKQHGHLLSRADEVKVGSPKSVECPVCHEAFTGSTAGLAAANHFRQKHPEEYAAAKAEKEAAKAAEEAAKAAATPPEGNNAQAPAGE